MTRRRTRIKDPIWDSGDHVKCWTMNTRTAYDVDEQHTKGKILVPSLVQNNGIVSIVRFWDDPRIMLIWKVPTLSIARGWTLKHFIDMWVFNQYPKLFLNTKSIESWRPYCPSLIFPLSPRGCIQHFENLWSVEHMFISNFILYGAMGTDWGTWFTISVYRVWNSWQTVWIFFYRVWNVMLFRKQLQTTEHKIA